MKKNYRTDRDGNVDRYGKHREKKNQSVPRLSSFKVPEPRMDGAAWTDSELSDALEDAFANPLRFVNGSRGHDTFLQRKYGRSFDGFYSKFRKLAIRDENEHYIPVGRVDRTSQPWGPVDRYFVMLAYEKGGAGPRNGADCPEWLSPILGRSLEDTRRGINKQLGRDQ